VSRVLRFQFEIVCQGDGRADNTKVEQLIDLNMQDLVFDDQFITALDEKQSVTIQVTRIG
jgi:hypothetical protein